MLEAVPVDAEVRVVGVGDPQPVDARVVDETEPELQSGRERGDDVAGVPERQLRRVSQSRRRPAGEDETGFDAEAAGGTPTSWMTKLPALVPVLARLNVRSWMAPGATKAWSGRGEAFSEPAGSAKSSRVVEPGTTVTFRVTDS